MAGRKLEYQIGVDSSKGVAGVKEFGRAVQQELGKIEGEFEDTATAGEKVATVLSRLAGELDTELAEAARAAEALGAALGPELAGRADVGALVGDLQRMGLSFDEIVVDADKLASSLKELDTVQMKGLDSGLGGVNTKLGDLDRSAGSSRSVMANMVGNATQDLGALTGVAGSAGVAIGQMGEYMADALGEGEKLGTVVSNFGKVAGPVAAISGALFVMEGVMKSIAQSKALEAERVKAYGEAMEGAGDEAFLLADKLREIGKIEFKDPTTGLFGGTGDLLPILAELGLGYEDFVGLITGGQAGVDEFVDSLWEMRENGRITTDTYVKLKNGVKQWSAATEEGRQIQEKLNDEFIVTTDMARQAQVAWIGATDPARLFGDQLLRISDALTSGDFDAQVLKDIEAVAEGLGIDIPAVYSLATTEGEKAAEAAKKWSEQYGEVSSHLGDIADELKRGKEFADGYARKMNELGLETEEALAEFEADKVDTLRTSFEEFLAIRQPGVGLLDTLGGTRDALQDIYGTVKDNEGAIPDIFKFGSEEGRNFRDQISAAADAVTTELGQALENAGGNFEAVRDRARELRAEMIEKIEVLTGLSMDVPAEREKILGLVNTIVPPDTDLEVGFRISRRDLNQAKADMALLRLEAISPDAALQMQLQLVEGEITPIEALRNTQAIFDATGVEVDLGVSTKKADDQYVEWAKKERTAQILAELDTAAIHAEIESLGPYYVNVLPRVGDIIRRGAGGPVPRDSFVTVGEHGPETVALPGGAYVYPHGATPTATVGTAGSTRNLVTQYVTIQAAVIGAPHDVTAAVEEGMRRANRLNPVNQ